ncbi:nuclear factor NF-kappa-B p100 subunit isoform X1 [Alosa sapidissima]|uniref:nuclear factor NF-kappa-B p100 subunit isoform X1 n=1 Tax=Alosa sapidissima TaxID=34773 RepID=UPI001C08EE13|nr:nuclear factor NF-kappa-B p100 subunit isoform X1 [Alosa sapidissima]
MTNIWTSHLELQSKIRADDPVANGMSGGLRMDESQYSMKMLESELLMESSYIENAFMPHLDIKSEPYAIETVDGPYLQIIEEPKQRGFRFRYECEGPSHGGLPGASSERNRRTYPTVKVCNYMGHARVEVQLVTHTDPPRVHAHSLVGRQCNENGTCMVDVGPNDLQAQFSNLGILHVTKRGVMEVLTKRLTEERRRQRESNYHFSDADQQAILNEAKELSKSMDLNIVRLKFTAYLQDSTGAFTRALKPVISNAIYDSKSPNASNLKISRMDRTCGSVLGGDEIFLLCDKVQKDDIDVRFFEEDDEGGWEAFGDFSPTDVHKQYAIVFKTPPYHSTEIDRAVTVFLQLKRKKGGDCSEPKQFTYVPQVQDKEEVERKRQKSLPHPHFDSWPGPQGGAGGSGRGAGGFGGPGGGMGGGAGYNRYNNQMDGPGFYGGGCGGFGGGGVLHMSASSGQQTSAVQQQQAAAASSPSPIPVQQQLLQIAAVLQNRATYTAKRTARALLEYCSSGDVRPLLAVQRHLCGVQDENGDTPLHLAIIHQQPAVVQQLLHSIVGIPQQNIINRLNHLGQSPLHLAVITRQLRVVELLLRVGADPSLLDRDGRTVVHLAALGANEVILRLLLTHLGERHAHLVNTADFSGLYPLHLAVRRGGERCLKLLVESGSKINAQEQKSGCTALHLAVKENLFKVACVLLTELKADVNVCTFGGNSPLHLAASQGSPPLCSMLIAAGANKSLENDEPLFFSSSSSDEDEEDRRVRPADSRQTEEDIGGQVQAVSSSLERIQINPRKRPAGGHKPFDLAKCQKVRNILDSISRLQTSPHTNKRPKPSTEESAGSSQPLDGAMMEKLCGLLDQSQVPWKELAEKLGMLTLAHLYQESPSPCQNLLENYQLAGGAVEGLVEALQSLGINEGVRLLRQTQVREDKQSTVDTTVDSGFGSQGIEDEDGELPAMATS